MDWESSFCMQNMIEENFTYIDIVTIENDLSLMLIATM